MCGTIGRHVVTGPRICLPRPYRRYNRSVSSDADMDRRCYSGGRHRTMARNGPITRRSRSAGYSSSRRCPPSRWSGSWSGWGAGRRPVELRLRRRYPDRRRCRLADPDLPDRATVEQRRFDGGSWGSRFRASRSGSRTPGDGRRSRTSFGRTSPDGPARSRRRRSSGGVATRLTRPESASRTRRWSRTGSGTPALATAGPPSPTAAPETATGSPGSWPAGERGADPGRTRRHASERPRLEARSPVGFCRPGASPRVCCWYTVPTATPAS